MHATFPANYPLDLITLIMLGGHDNICGIISLSLHYMLHLHKET